MWRVRCCRAVRLDDRGYLGVCRAVLNLAGGEQQRCVLRELLGFHSRSDDQMRYARFSRGVTEGRCLSPVCTRV